MGLLGRLLGKHNDNVPAGVFPSVPPDAIPASSVAGAAPAAGVVSLVSIAKPVWSYGLESVAGVLPEKSGPAKRIAFAQLATPGLADLRERLARPEDELCRFARGLPAWLAETMYFSSRYAPIAAVALLDPARLVLLPEPWSPANIRQLVETSPDGLDYVVTGTVADAPGGERTLTVSLWDVARAAERKTWLVRWRADGADRELAGFHQHFRLFMEWTAYPEGNGLAYAPTRYPANWVQTLGACTSLFLAEKASLARETIELKPDLINLAAEQAVTGEIASLAWLSLSTRAKRLGLVWSLSAVQLLPTATVKTAAAALA